MSPLSSRFVDWAQALPSDRWGGAGISREERRRAQLTGRLEEENAWRLAWSALAHESLDALRQSGVWEALWLNPPDGVSALEQSLGPLPLQPSTTRGALARNWLALAKQAQAEEGAGQEGSRWAKALGESDKWVVGAYLAGMCGSASYFELGELSIDSWENVVLDILEKVPTSLLLSQRDVLENMKHAHQPPELLQLDRWEAALVRHQEGFESWVTSDLHRKGRRLPGQTPRSWVWLLDTIFSKAPELVDRPACGFAVVLGSVLATDMRKDSTTLLKKTPTLDALNRALPLIPALRNWAQESDGVVLEWVESKQPGLSQKMRERTLRMALPAAAPAPSPKPRF